MYQVFACQKQPFTKKILQFLCTYVRWAIPATPRMAKMNRNRNLCAPKLIGTHNWLTPWCCPMSDPSSSQYQQYTTSLILLYVHQDADAAATATAALPPLPLCCHAASVALPLPLLPSRCAVATSLALPPTLLLCLSCHLPAATYVPPLPRPCRAGTAALPPLTLPCCHHAATATLPLLPMRCHR
jgi:hypothetical protein